MESFRKENTESKNSQLWLGWLDLNQRMSVSKTDTLNHLATPHHGTPHRIRTDTLQILNLLPAANWASGALSWPYYYYPILAYLPFTPTNFSYAPQMAVSRAIPFNCQQVDSTISWEHIDSTTLLMVCQGVFENYFLEGSR